MPDPRRVPRLLDTEEATVAGTRGDGPEQPGGERIREIVERCRIGLTVCGHVHWEAALASRGDTYVLNVDARVVVLVRE